MQCVDKILMPNSKKNWKFSMPNAFEKCQFCEIWHWKMPVGNSGLPTSIGTLPTRATHAPTAKGH